MSKDYTETIDDVDVTATPTPVVLDELAYLAERDRERRWMTADADVQALADSIFRDHTRLFTQYLVTIQFRDKVMGGIPKDPKIIEGWLRSKAGITDETEVLNMVRRTLEEQGIEVSKDATMEDMITASESIAAVKSTNGFLRDKDGLYIPGRYVKSMLKEVTNILWAGDRWGPTRKGPKNFLAERVFVLEDAIHLGRQEPDGIEMVIGHVDGPQGKRSTLGYHEYCVRAECSFHVMSMNDCITPNQWGDILELAQEDGLGALRSQQHGRFNVTDISRVVKPPKDQTPFAIRDDFNVGDDPKVERGTGPNHPQAMGLANVSFGDDNPGEEG